MAWRDPYARWQWRWRVVCGACALLMALATCVHTDGAAKPKKKRHRKHVVQDANTQATQDDDTKPVAEPREVATNTWQVEADGRTFEEAAQRAAHAAVVWCGERHQVPLPETDAHRRTARGLHMTFVFHCVALEQEESPQMPLMDLDPMPLDPD